MNASTWVYVFLSLAFVCTACNAVCSYFISESGKITESTERRGWFRQRLRLVAMLLAIGTATGVLGGAICTKRASDSAASEANARQRHLSAIVGVCDLERLLADFDTHFGGRGFDSARHSFEMRGVYGSGVYLKGMIAWAIDARRRRDHMIDSCLVRLAVLGVKTDTLRYEKRLPIRIGQALKGRAEMLGLDAGDLLEVLRCDSL